MGKDKRTIDTMKEQSEKAKAEPRLEAKDNKGQRGNYIFLQEITSDL